jgi:DNA-binding transcriptional ArsR family regulator
MAAVPDRTDLALDALADGTRRAILEAVKDAPLAVGHLAERLGISQQTASHHLGVLRQAGVVRQTRSGTRHLYAVNTDGLAAVRDYLDGFWPAKLAALRDTVEGRAQP